MADSSSDKPHKPTKKKLKDARKRGEVPRSSDVGQTFTFLAMVAMLALFGPTVVRNIQNLWLGGFLLIAMVPVSNEGNLAYGVFRIWMENALPFIGAALVAAIAGAACQVGGLVAFAKVKPEMKNINPGEGIKKLFSVKSLFNVTKLLIKSGLILSTEYLYISSHLPEVISLAHADVSSIRQGGAGWLMPIFGIAAATYVMSSAVDYMFVRYHFMKMQRMSTDELRREHKESEGDPLLKSKRKSIAREEAFFGLKDRMAYASAVIHGGNTALALYYDGENLPQVIAKGQSEAAERICAEANARLVPIKEDAQLTEIISTAVMLDRPIDEAHLEMVKKLFDWASGRTS